MAFAQTGAGVLISEPVMHVLEAGDGTTHQLFVALPRAYHSDAEARFPVMYLLDGNTLFAMTTQAYAYMDVFRELGPIIIVGLGYPVDDWHDVLIQRTRDYTPTRDAAAEKWLAELVGHADLRSGGADAYLSFIRERVVPLIETEYRTSDERVLGGFSYGGLFAAYALFTKPGTFSGYLLGSPSLNWDSGVMLEIESDFAGRSRSLPGRVLLTAGSLEESTAEAVSRLAEILSRREYEGLDLVTHVFEGETHLSVIPATMSRGLRELFGSTRP